MISRIIDIAVNNRFMVVICTVVIAMWAAYATYNLPVDAIPDLSDVQVIISTEYSEQAPQIVEDQVTYPLATAMLAVPKTKAVRGYSQFGVSFVYIIFEDGTDIYWARSRVLEYLNYVRGKLPPNVTPALGPDATGVGWVFEYVVEDPTGRRDLSQLRSIQDWYLRYQLQRVPGVAEVASVGGFVKQYQVVVNPNTLASYGIPLSKVKQAIQMSNQDTGGRVVEHAGTEYMVRALGYIKGLKDVENIVVGVDRNGTPLLIKDVALVRLGPDLRRGLAEANGEGEVVGGIVIARFGANARAVIDGVKEKLEELKAGLPPGVRIVTAYDRTHLIQRAINYLKEKLVEEMLVVALVCVIFLLHFRSSLVAIVTLPLGVLISLAIMYQFDISANIMSLGGIALAIGVMVDAAVIMIENAHKHIEHAPPDAPRAPLVLEAAKEVGPSLFFSLLVITVSFLPIFVLTGESGRLFKPLAYTKTFAMAAASILAVTLVPVMMVVFLKGKIPPESRNPLNRLSMRLYHPALGAVLRFPKTAIILAIILVLATIYPFSQLGSEFMPPLDEGDLLYMPITVPGISITQAKNVLQQTDRIIRTFPEVEYVFGKVGRAETATDPAPLSMIETTIRLKDRSLWRPGMTTAKLIEELNAAVKFPGLSNSWGYPIKIRNDMLSTGIKSPVGFKILGPDLDVLSRLATEAEAIFKSIPETSSAFAERVTGGYYLDFEINRKEAARYGLTVGDIQDVIASALGGMTLTQTVEGLERYPVNLRYFQDYRQGLSTLGRVLIPTMNGAQIPMEQVARIKVHQGPDMIRSENARRAAWLTVDVRDIDVGSYIKKAQEAIKARLKLPEGYSYIWSGQFEYMERARQKLQIIIPITLVIIFFILYINTGSLTKVCIILLAVPFSLVGAIWLLYILSFWGYHLSLAVVVGIIALAGLDAETGVVMLLYLDLAYHRAQKEGRLLTYRDTEDAVIEGAVQRLRPKLMTVLAILVGLAPLMWGSGTGSEAMKRIAAPMVGGVATSFLMELLIYPAIYLLWKWHWEVKPQKFPST
ncbi:MAG: cation transporter [Deltaproteobacteria bacterium RBG_13_60_28]|nr:MAG: cation transporter [Deltaproteobacteria bacterium RBG_13_60_28]